MITSDQPPVVIAPRVDRWGDLLDRLSSRAFLLTVLVIALAFGGWISGNMPYGQFVEVALWAAGIFTGAERVSDAAGKFASKPASTPITVVNTTPQAGV